MPDSKNLTNSILAVCRLQKKNGGKVIMPIFEQIKAYKQIQEDRLSFKDYLKVPPDITKTGQGRAGRTEGSAACLQTARIASALTS